MAETKLLIAVQFPLVADGLFAIKEMTLTVPLVEIAGFVPLVLDLKFEVVLVEFRLLLRSGESVNPEIVAVRYFATICRTPQSSQ
jgi:hypothetical protein